MSKNQYKVMADRILKRRGGVELDYNTLTKKELRALCDAEGIEYGKNDTKDKLIERLQS